MKKALPITIPVQFIKRFSLILLFAGSLFSLKAGSSSARGYLITKNGVTLTGTISEIFDNNQILFINDFGTPYKIHAAIVYGFVVPRKGKKVFFASKYNGKKWYFMQLLHQGEGMNLYSAPVTRVQSMGAFQHNPYRVVRTTQLTTYFVELKGRLPVEIKRGNFKRKMRKLLKKQAPEMAERLGKKGYRFKNLEEIIEKYNAIVKKDLINL